MPFASSLLMFAGFAGSLQTFPVLAASNESLLSSLNCSPLTGGSSANISSGYTLYARKRQRSAFFWLTGHTRSIACARFHIASRMPGL
jgi:hypothetical protein